MKCKALFCGRSSNKDRELKFFRFPKDPAARYHWIRFCVQRDEEVQFFTIKPSFRLCSAHFPDGKANTDGSLNVPVRIGEPENVLLDEETAEPAATNDGTATANPDKELATEIFKLREKVTKLKRTVNQWKNKCKLLQAEKRWERKLFRDDQIKLLSGEIRKVKQWHPDTITDSLQIRFACQGGYEKLIKKGFPFPSTRTLLRQISKVGFAPGILDDIFDLMKQKTEMMGDNSRHCGILIGEMSTAEAREVCEATKQLVGNTTMPVTEQMSSTGLVFMLVGIHSRWQQVVVYEHTEPSIDTSDLVKEAVAAVVLKAEEIGLLVHFCTSNSENRRFWNDLGVYFTKEDIYNDLSVLHPGDDARRLEVLPDPTHLFKNVVNHWINNGYLAVPKWYVEQKGLISNYVHRDHLRMLVEHDKNSMSHSLTATDVAFEKKEVEGMKLCFATRYCNLEVSAALRVYAAETGHTEVITTACFLEDVSRWYAYITNRKSECALSMVDGVLYQDTIDHLNNTAKLISDIGVDAFGHWNPWQSGVVMCTNAIVRLTVRLFGLGLTKILTTRFSQECLDSMFSLIHTKHQSPTPMEFRNKLKSMTLSQYMAKIPNASCVNDDQNQLVNVIDSLPQTQKDQKERTPKKSKPVSQKPIAPIEPVDCTIDYDALVAEANRQLDRAEQNTLYNIAGYLFVKISKLTTSCKTCVTKFTRTADKAAESTRFAMLHTKAVGSSNHFITDELFHYFLAMERLFRKYRTQSSSGPTDLVKKLTEKLMVLPADVFHCYTFRHMLINRFILFRMKSGLGKQIPKATSSIKPK